MKVTNYDVTIELTEPMLGTIPKDKEIYATFIESKKPKDSPYADNEVDTVDNDENKGWTGFHSDDNGLFVYDYLVKGFLKNAGNVLKDQLKVKALRNKINNNIFVSPRKIYLGKDTPDGCIERPLRAMTMQGERITLARSDYVDNGLQLNFSIKMLEFPGLSEKVLKDILSYGELMGLGQFRNGGYGRFKVLNMDVM